MNNDAIISPSIIAASLIIMAIVAWIKIDQYLSFRHQELKATAVQGCMQVSSYTVTTDDVTTVTPMDDIYTKCMQEKGY